MRTAKKIALFSGVTNPSFELDLDNVATDFTFTRASSATYVDVNGTIQTAKGSELITNGVFDSNVDGWNQDTGTLEWDAGRMKVTSSEGGFGLVYTPISTVIGQTYDVSVDLVETSFNTYFIIGTSSTSYVPETIRIIDNSTTTGTHTGQFVATATTHYVWAFSPAQATDSYSIWDNITIKQITNVPRIDYSDATFDVPVYADLITNGDFVTDTIWTYDPSYTISGGVASYDGVSSGINIKQADADLSEPLKANTDYTLQFTISNAVAEARLFILDHSGSKVFVATTNYADGTHVINFTTPADIGIGGIAFYTYNVSGGDAFDIDDISLTGVSSYTTTDEPAFLLEPASENLIAYSEDFSNAWWTSTNADVTDNTNTSPENTSDATFLQEDGATAVHHVYKTSTIALSDATDYTFSCFVKVGDTDRYVNLGLSSGANSWISVKFNIDTDTFSDVFYQDTKFTDGSARSESLSNGWIRISLSFTKSTTEGCYPAIAVSKTMTTPTAGSYGLDSYLGDNASGFYIWGGQLEALSYPTSYIPTTGATATRATETCVDGGSASVINSEEGTLLIDWKGFPSSYNNFSLSDGSTTTKIVIYTINATGYMRCQFVKSGESTVTIVKQLTQPFAFDKIGIKWKDTTLSLFVNGTKVNDATIVPYDADTLNSITFDYGNNTGGQAGLGWYRNLKIYKEALSDSDLESKTT